MVYVWGLDDGYSAVKATTDGENEILIPNAVTPYVKRMRSESLSSKEISSLDYLGIDCEEGQFIIGKGAMEQSQSLLWSGGNNKHRDLNFSILAKASLGVMSGRMSGIHINPLVMGLPVDEDESNERHSLLQKLMVKKHEMNLIYPDGREIGKSIYVDDLIIKKQPVGSLGYFILNKSGMLGNEELAKGFNLVIDIGFKTLNIITLKQLELISELSGTYNYGLHMAYDRVCQVIKDRLGISVPTGKIPLVISQRKIGKYDLSDVINKTYRYLANEVINLVETLYVNSWGYCTGIILTGGGSTALKSYLEQAFPIKPIFGDRFSTAKGLWRWGVRSAIKQSEGKIVVNVPSGGSIVLGKQGSV